MRHHFREELKTLNEKISASDYEDERTFLYDELELLRERIWETLVKEIPEELMFELGVFIEKNHGFDLLMTLRGKSEFFKKIKSNRIPYPEILDEFERGVWSIFMNNSEEIIVEFIEKRGKTSKMKKIFENRMT